MDLPAIVAIIGMGDSDFTVVASVFWNARSKAVTVWSTSASSPHSCRKA